MITEDSIYTPDVCKVDDTLIGIILFWCITSRNKDTYNLEYFNSKMYRYLGYSSTFEQMEQYKKMSVSIEDGNITTDDIKIVIDTIDDIYALSNLNYQLHMYGGGGASGDYWLDERDKLITEMDKIFSIIASSNGVSIVYADKLEISPSGWDELFTYFNRIRSIDKLL